VRPASRIAAGYETKALVNQREHRMVTAGLSWFGPLGEDATGVAEFASHLIPSLTEIGNVRVWALPRHHRSARLACLGADCKDVRTYSESDDYIPVYNIGNSVFHICATQLALCRPGIIILHDTQLDSLLPHFSSDRTWCRAGERTPCSTPGGILAELIDRSLAVVVHSRAAADAVQRLGRPCELLHLPYDGRLVDASPIAAASHGMTSQWLPKALGLSSPCNKKSLLIFGHLGGNRRLNSVIQAISSLPERAHFRLDVYGRGVDSTTRALVRACRLGAIIRFHGPVSDAVLNAALRRADLGVNLRFPTMGESSLSQLRFWAHGVPTVCTATPNAAHDVHEFVRYVRHDHEVDDLHQVLRDLLAEPRRFAQLGATAKAHVSSVHCPRSYAQALWHICRQANALSRPAGTH